MAEDPSPRGSRGMSRAALSAHLPSPVRRIRRRLRRRAEEEARMQGKLDRELKRTAQLRVRVRDAEEQNQELRVSLQKEQEAHEQLRSLLAPNVVNTNQGSPASFRRHLLDLRRGTRSLPALDSDARHPLRQIPRKLRNYQLAASHSVQVPEVYRVWGDLEDLNLDDLPDSFVIKSDRGAGGRGVLPLHRVDDGMLQLVGGTKTFSTETVVKHLSHKSLGSPFFAEEILVQPDGGDLPEDIKFYMFYGEVGHVMLRRMPQHADLSQARFGFFDEEGRALPDDVSTSRKVDTSIEPPARLAEFVEIARHLSRAVAIPFVRVDVYDTVRGPVFGELTRAPGGKQFYRDDHDRRMGEMWDRAQFRLDLDVVAGRPFRNLHGEHAADSLYPSGYEAPGSSVVIDQTPPTTPCTTWCYGSPVTTKGSVP